MAGVLILLALLLSSSAAVPPQRTVVSEVYVNIYVSPDETSPVDDQAVLGEYVEVLEETNGFARVRPEDHGEAWIPERAIRRGVAAPAHPLEITSPWAHLYSTPDFTRSRP